MAETFDVYEPAGALIGAIPVSPRDRSVLHNGGTVTISFHTPRMLQQALGSHNGAFEVMETDGKLFTNNPEQVKQYIMLQTDIARAMKDRSKWSDPDAESDPPIR